ncbi:MAG: preprotein translocase subunit SecA [Planctomycetota bacterium]|nr:preprotein translocase subunit SecA [Planctomycetota bacterium]
MNRGPVGPYGVSVMVDFGALSGKFGKSLQKVFGSANERTLASFKPVVDSVNKLEDWAKEMDGAQIQARVQEWREKIGAGSATLDDAMPEIFAMTREASVRTLGLRHFDVQLIGGVNLHRGNISEMVTGEGKTLVATLAAALNALSGEGVYIVTVNDYLAQRDRDWMAPIFEYLGLTVGAIQSDMSPRDRHAHYACDIVYGTNNEFGFDYLRDNMKWEPDEQVQKRLSYAIVDEVDSILVDEARTPLIISGPPEGKADKYLKSDRIAKQLEPDKHFEIKLKEQQCLLSEEGIERSEQLVGVESFYSDPELMDWPHHIEQSLKAHNIYQRDKEYVVVQNQESGETEVVIVDEFTGRLMAGRRWSDGLHQAVEAKEGLPPREETQVLATITLQNYFRMFDKLAGMTGTAMTEAGEFSKIYDLDVLAIPTNRPMRRADEQDQIYLDADDKYTAIIEEVRAQQATGRPILIGTTSIAKSEEVSRRLEAADVDHKVLNAKRHAYEAQIIAQAGRKGAVTVATNMAGRGTDIVLGGNVDGLLRDLAKEKGIALDSPEAGALREKLEVECAAEHEEVIESGGLAVIATERHEARRIDNQLRGRCGRQGDPGSTKFFLCFDDDLMRIFARDWVKPLMEKLGLKHGERIESGMVSRRIAGAQKKVEQRNFDIRKNLIEYDEVMDAQRKFIYGQRQEMLLGRNLRDKALGMFEEVLLPALELHAGDPDKPVEYDEIRSWMTHKFGSDIDLDGLDGAAREELEDFLVGRVEAKYTERGEHYGEVDWLKIQQFILLETMDNKWKDHLFAMDVLKHGIGLRGYAQMDPKNEYKKEGFEKFELLKTAIADQVTDLLFKVELQAPPELEQPAQMAPPPMPSDPATQQAFMEAMIAAGQAPPEVMEAFAEGKQIEVRTQEEVDAQRSEEVARQQAARTVTGGKKPKRNEPCPCGSGVKYKKCCHPAFG